MAQAPAAAEAAASAEVRVLINRLSRLMGERRLTIQDVATGTGLSWRTVQDLYHDRSKRLDLETLNKLCFYLGVGPSDIFEPRRTEADPPPWDRGGAGTKERPRERPRE